MIHKVENKFVASSRGVWILGVYQSERTAKYAFKFTNEQLSKLQERKNQTTKVITFKDLQDLRKKLNVL